MGEGWCINKIILKVPGHCPSTFGQKSLSLKLKCPIFFVLKFGKMYSKIKAVPLVVITILSL